jgi:flagellin
MQSASAGVSDSQRVFIQAEADQLTSELDRNANATKYNGTALLNTVTALDFQVGIENNATNDRIAVSTIDVTSATLTVDGLDFATASGAQTALDSIDSAIDTVSQNRAELGAAGNRFQSAIENIQTFSESLSAANSRIRDVDVAEETSNMAKSQILVQAGISVLSQANQAPQLALKLLG